MIRFGSTWSKKIFLVDATFVAMANGFARVMNHEGNWLCEGDGSRGPAARATEVARVFDELPILILLYPLRVLGLYLSHRRVCLQRFYLLLKRYLI